MGHLKRNNQIAHPDKFDRYFQLDIDCLSYRTADVKNVIYNFNENEIIDFLLMQEENGTSYGMLEDIQARISELSDARAKVIISALLKSMKGLNKLVYKSWLSINAGFYAKHMLARALYKDAPLLILDEPTAALDPIAESKIYNEFNVMAKNKTSLFISHRLASTSFCDRIILLENGNITEEGTHQELMGANGTYKGLFDIQSCWYKEDMEGGDGE